MSIRTKPFLAACLVALGSAPFATAAGPVVLQTSQFRLEIGDDARAVSLRDRQGNLEYAAADPACPFAVAYRNGRLVPEEEGQYAASTGRWLYRGEQIPADRLTQDHDRLILHFSRIGARAIVRVRTAERYLAFELLAMEGSPVDRVEFVRLPLRKLPHTGQWVNANYDDRFGVCLCAGNLQADVQTTIAGQRVCFTAAADRSIAFQGPTAVLFGWSGGRDRFLDAMATVEHDFHLPSGVAFRRSPLQRLSYLWAKDPTPANIDEYIDFARRGGFRMILFSYTAFSTAPGHFDWNDRYPGGMADLRRVTTAIRNAGLKLGLHVHYCKAGKKDRYVTPVPDDRLNVVRRFTLASQLSGDATTIPVREDPAGCTMDPGRRILKLGKELIEYGRYSQSPPFQFLDCRRGHLGTASAGHPAGSAANLLDVDTWPAFIRFDQKTDIQDEVARRIAEIYRQTGPYEMVYLDGAEDVHEPFWYHVASAQYRVFRLLDPPPPVCESAMYTHFSWHMVSRSNAYDTIAAPSGMKDFCRLMPCPTAAARVDDFSRIQFGWLGRFGRVKGGTAGPDVYEYIVSRAAAWDCPLSLHASLAELRSQPRADCLAVFRTWEDARLGNHLSADQLQQLRNVQPADAHYVRCYQQREMLARALEGRDLTESQKRILADRREHHLFLNEQGRYELVEAEELPSLPPGLKAWLFRRASRPADAWLLAWATEGERRLRLPLAKLSAMRPFGTPLPTESRPAGTEVLVGDRTYLLLPDTSTAAARELMSKADIIP